MSQSLQSRVQGGDQTHNQLKLASTSFHRSNVQRIPVQTRDQTALQAFSQQFKPRPGGGNQTSST